jgi:hypothetical protein
MTANGSNMTTNPSHPRDPKSATVPYSTNKSTVQTPLSVPSIKPGFFLAKWLLFPLLLAGLLVAFGMHLGANGADKWYTRGVVWIVNLFLSPPDLNG